MNKSTGRLAACRVTATGSGGEATGTVTGMGGGGGGGVATAVFLRHLRPGRTGSEHRHRASKLRVKGKQIAVVGCNVQRPARHQRGRVDVRASFASRIVLPNQRASVDAVVPRSAAAKVNIAV